VSKLATVKFLSMRMQKRQTFCPRTVPVGEDTFGAHTVAGTVKLSGNQNCEV